AERLLHVLGVDDHAIGIDKTGNLLSLVAADQTEGVGRPGRLRARGAAQPEAAAVVRSKLELVDGAEPHPEQAPRIQVHALHRLRQRHELLSAALSLSDDVAAGADRLPGAFETVGRVAPRETVAINRSPSAAASETSAVSMLVPMRWLGRISRVVHQCSHTLPPSSGLPAG